MARRPAFYVAALLWAGIAQAAPQESRACRILLVPGAFAGGKGGSGTFISSDEYFREYREYFKAKGCDVRGLEFPADGTIEQRALILKDQLLHYSAEKKGTPIVIIAHSQGGLDARFALKTLRVENVSAVVTIGTPHSGTPLADFVLKQRESGGLLYWLLRLGFGYDLRALHFAGEMTASFLEQKRSYFEPVPGVRFASGRGYCKTHCYWLLRGLDWIVGLPEGDGLIPAESQRFGEDLGEFDLDHLSEIGVDPEKAPERKRFLDRVWESLKFASLP